MLLCWLCKSCKALRARMFTQGSLLPYMTVTGMPFSMAFSRSAAASPGWLWITLRRLLLNDVKVCLDASSRVAGLKFVKTPETLRKNGVTAESYSI